MDWFVHDLARECSNNFVRLGQLVVLKMDTKIVQREPTYIEMQRIARGLFRFETFGRLFAPKPMSEDALYRDRPSQLAIEYLNTFDPDEVEEIATVRDYLIRKLWRVFDRIEDNFVHTESTSFTADQASVQKDWASDEENFFGRFKKSTHLDYMENLMSLGLPFLHKLLTSDDAQSTAMVFSNANAVSGFLTETLLRLANGSVEPPWYDSGRYLVEYSSAFNEASDETSVGWHWGQRLTTRLGPGNMLKKGCRDFGYVFWEKTRMQASGVLIHLYVLLHLCM